jgi:hypothetical protein
MFILLGKHPGLVEQAGEGDVLDKLAAGRKGRIKKNKTFGLPKPRGIRDDKKIKFEEIRGLK